MTPGDPSAKSVDGKGWGVHVSEIGLDQTPFRMHLDPTSPYAQKSGEYKGYVLDSNVNSITEMVNQMEATRAYEANAVGAEATKLMIGQALRLLG